MSDNLRWAAGVAETVMVLKDSAYKGSSSYEQVKELLMPIADDEFRTEFLYLINKID